MTFDELKTLVAAGEGERRTLKETTGDITGADAMNINEKLEGGTGMIWKGSGRITEKSGTTG